MIATRPPADEKADHEEAEGRNREDLNEALGKYATREYRDSPEYDRELDPLWCAEHPGDF